MRKQLRHPHGPCAPRTTAPMLLQHTGTPSNRGHTQQSSQCLYGTRALPAHSAMLNHLFSVRPFDERARGFSARRAWLAYALGCQQGGAAAAAGPASTVGAALWAVAELGNGSPLIVAGGGAATLEICRTRERPHQILRF